MNHPISPKENKELDKIINTSSVCFKCGEKYGNHKKKFMGIWKDTCSICHKKEVSCADARHDFGINISDLEFDLSNYL
jgi:hypothetical protein